jgi:hypothetical protein
MTSNNREVNQMKCSYTNKWMNEIVFS